MKASLKILLCAAGLLGASAFAQSSDIPGAPSAPSILDDPEWQKRFLGSYGFRSALEPKITEDEKVVLQELIELMKADPEAAAMQLKGNINDKSSAALNFILANLYFQSSDTVNAKKYYMAAVEIHPDYLRAHKNLGLLLLQEQDFNQSLKHLARATELGEMDGRTQGLMGYAYLSQENLLAAEECYRDAIQMEPDVLDWKLGLGRVLIETTRNGEAIALFENLIKSTPNDTQLWLLQANAYLGAGDPQKAAVNLEMVRSMGGSDAESLRLLGDIYLNMKISDLALGAYSEAMDASDQGGAALAIRSARLLYQTGSAAKAKTLLEQASDKYSDTMPQEQKMELLTLQATIAKSEGNTDEAIQTLEDIISQDGMQGDALVELAVIYHDRGQEDDQATAYLLLERAKNISGYEYDALVKHAQLLVSERQYQEAVKLLEAALQFNDDPRTRDFLNRVRRAIRS